MDRFFEEDTGGASYRSNDPVKNLRLSITLQRVSPAMVGFLAKPQQDPTSDTSTSGPTTSPSSSAINEFGQSILEEEKLECCWQQKYFSEREFKSFSDTPINGTVQDFKYHGEIQKLKKIGGRPNKRLFTYCDEDHFDPLLEERTPVTTAITEVPTYLSTNVDGLRRRKGGAPASNTLSSKLKQGQGARGLKIVVEEPSEEFRQHNHIINTPVHRMLIMADLGPEELGDRAYEKCLCEIEYDENGVLGIIPDFSRSKLPYRKETHLSRDIWLFKIHNASTAMSRMDLQKEAKVLKQLYNKHQKYLTELVGTEFEAVRKGTLRLVLNGEILSAQSFEYDDLHVEYFLDLPRNWSCNTNNTSGCTQTCRTKLENNVEVAYFCHPFNFDTYLATANDDQDLPYEWPKIFVQVVSCDTWGRRRAEGYGYASIPSSPGRHILKTRCWRPIGNAGCEAIGYELRRFFTGSSAELEDYTYTAIPSTFDGKILNKFGVRTESTGTVTIQIDCLTQEEPETIKPDAVTDHVSRRRQQTALQLAKGKATNEAMLNVMDSFLRARKRMQSARDKVPEHIRTAAEDRSRLPPIGDKAKKLSGVLSGTTTWKEETENDTE